MPHRPGSRRVGSSPTAFSSSKDAGGARAMLADGFLKRFPKPDFAIAAPIAATAGAFGLFIAFFGAFVAQAYTTAAAFAVLLALLVVRPAGLAAQ